MKLHRLLHHTQDLPDWATVLPGTRNPWQHLAVTTRGIITPGNAISLLGFGLVCTGLWAMVQHAFIAGFVWIVLGRLCDLLDGMVADRTGTKSPLGEATDAGFDKAGAVLALITASVTGVVPWWVAALVGIQNIVNVVIGLVGRRRKTGLHPALTGKLSTALEWIALAGFILAAGGYKSWIIPAYVLLAAALGLGVYASASYIRRITTAGMVRGKHAYIGRSFKPNR
jgi:phosphatidylglycerophosphate synthase